MGQEKVGSRGINWWGSSKKDLRDFPERARREAGHQLDGLQRGYEPDDWRPVKAVGPGTWEIRIHDGGEYRVFYVTKFGDTIDVLHAFVKKEEKTRQEDIDKARQRYREAEQWHKEGSASQ